MLDEKITMGADTMTRREFYQRMFYRGAMSRTAALPSGYRDDIIGGNTLITGANRVLGYAMAMRMVADVLTDPAKKKQVLEKYAPTIQEVADAQGKFSGGFPLLGEGDRYAGKGLHYDAGYIRTHMDWLVLGVRRTGDPLLVQMLRRYQDVFEAVMDSEGTGLLPMISERHQGTRPVQLILSDATSQVGMQYQLAGHRAVGVQLRHAYVAGRRPAVGQPFQEREQCTRVQLGRAYEHPRRRHGGAARAQGLGVSLPAAVPDLVLALVFQGRQAGADVQHVHSPGWSS